MAARTEDELRDLLSGTLRVLFQDRVRYEVYVADRHGTFEFDPMFAEFRQGRRGPVKGTLLSRLLMEGDPAAHAAACRLAALHGIRRGRTMSAPLMDARVPVGLIVLEAEPESPGFTTVDLELLECVAGLVSLVLLRQRSPQARRCATCVERVDRASASQVQRRLMTTSLPVDVGVTVDARYLPALNVGGDFYELASLGDGKVGCAIGDVSGKGVSAALIMSRVSSDVRRALRSGCSPSAVLTRVNDGLTEEDDETFVTASCLCIDARRRKLTVANAGHVPLMVRRASGEVLTVGSASGIPLGIMRSSYADEEVDLAPGDIVLLMTDGVVEALDWPGDPTGARNLLQLVRSAPHDPRTINARITEAVNEASGDEPADDVTLVALQIAG